MNRVRGTLHATAAAIVVAGIALPTTAAAAPARHDTGWTQTAADVVSSTNIRTHGSDSTLSDPARHPTSRHQPGGYGTETLAAHRLDTPARSVRARLRADQPAGAHVTVEVRGQRSPGQWTQWHDATAADRIDLGAPVSTVQARLTLTGTHAAPRVHRLRLTTVAGPTTAPQLTDTALTADVFATREGLVGGTTANGHVITAEDHFVALPSSAALASNGGDEYQVQVCNGATCLVEPVWDIGPWNVNDDYWNSPRAQFNDLPQGRPEADAAYYDGYNGGLDGSGRQVSNPAGIDLADGVFHDLGMADNGVVTVTYLWTGTAATPPADN